MAEALSADRIQELLSKSKSRGEYGGMLKDFLNSAEAGVEIDLKSGPLQGKRAKMVKVGFDNARKKTDDNGLVYPGGKEVRVIAITGKVTGEDGKEVDAPNNDDDHVYLINTALASGAASEDSDEAAA